MRMLAEHDEPMPFADTTPSPACSERFAIMDIAKQDSFSLLEFIRQRLIVVGQERDALYQQLQDLQAFHTAEVQDLKQQLASVTADRDEARRQVEGLQQLAAAPLADLLCGTTGGDAASSGQQAAGVVQRPAEPATTTAQPSTPADTQRWQTTAPRRTQSDCHAIAGSHVAAPPRAYLEPQIMEGLLFPEAAVPHSAAEVPYHPPDALGLCSTSEVTPEGLPVITLESCTEGCRRHPSLAVHVDTLYPYEASGSIPTPSFESVIVAARFVFMSPALMSLFEMGGNMDKALEMRNKGGRPSAIRAVVKGIWRAFFIERDLRPSIVRGVVYHASAPTHFVCTHVSPCIFEAADGQRHWASFAHFDCTSPDYVDRVTCGVLMEHQAIKYSPTSVIMTNALGRVVYQNPASVEALGLHASHMREVEDFTDADAQVNYLHELFQGNQAMLDEMYAVTGKAEIFRGRLRISSQTLLSWLNVEDVEMWHDVQVAKARDAMDKSPIYIVAQVDVTEAVLMERQVKQLQEQQQILLSSILPQQVINVLLQAASEIVEVGQCGALRVSHSPHARLLDRRLSKYPSTQPTPSSHYSPPNSPGKLGLGQVKQYSSARTSKTREPVLASTRKLNDLSRYHEQVTILFSDIEGFTSLSQRFHPQVVIIFLNELYSRLDKIVDSQGPLGVYKVETIGDSYMVCGGLFQFNESGQKTLGGFDSQHAHKVLAFARGMVAAAAQVLTPLGEPVKLRIGMHSGPCMSGVVGHKMPRFCLFGDTVNTASRMESTGQSGRVHVSQATRDLLPDEAWLATGGINVKGKGLMQTYFLG